MTGPVITWEPSTIESRVAEVFYLSRNGVNFYPWIKLVVYKSGETNELNVAWWAHQGTPHSPQKMLSQKDYLWMFHHPDEFWMELSL